MVKLTGILPELEKLYCDQALDSKEVMARLDLTPNQFYGLTKRNPHLTEKRKKQIKFNRRGYVVMNSLVDSDIEVIETENTSRATTNVKNQLKRGVFREPWQSWFTDDPKLVQFKAYRRDKIPKNLLDLWKREKTHQVGEREGAFRERISQEFSGPPPAYSPVEDGPSPYQVWGYDPEEMVPLDVIKSIVYAQER